MERKIKILFLAANPRDTTRLSLDEEIRQILKRIRAAEEGARFEVVSELALRPEELPAALMRHRPDIVHFSGHGTTDGALCLVQDATQRTQPLTTEQLLDLFKPLSSDIRCVVLNACYSATQAQAIASCVPCVVGMSRAVKDETATAFAAGFYEALAFGKSVQTAFDLGRAQAGLLTTPAPGAQNEPLRSLKKKAVEEHAPSEKEIPQLVLRDGTDASKLVLAPRPDPWAALAERKRDPLPASDRAKQSIKVGGINISGNNNVSSINQSDTYSGGVPSVANLVDEEIEVGSISISGSGNVSNISQSRAHGTDREPSPSPLAQARQLAQELAAALPGSPLRPLQKQMAEPAISLLKNQLSSAAPVRAELTESLEDLRPLFGSAPALLKLLDRLIERVSRLPG